jgi:NitT/TauT family transport system ATP-binding protein
MATLAPEPLLRLRDITQAYRKGGTSDLLVLDGINMSLWENQIVGLLGRSGCGKSTILRIVSGLIPPTSGNVLFRDNAVSGPVPGVAMVFQTFALFPWLTVLENVELGLEALGIAADERRQRALTAIDLIGLDGFESA